MTVVAEFPAVRVLVFSARTRMWVVRATATSKAELDQVLSGIARTERVRCVRATAVVASKHIPPPAATAAREHRLAVAMAMSDRADSNKHYKSPG